MTNRNVTSTTAALQEFFDEKKLPMAVSLTCDNAKSHDIIKPSFPSTSMSPVSSRRSRLPMRPSSYPSKSLLMRHESRHKSTSSLASDNMMISTSQCADAKRVVHLPAHSDHQPKLKPILKAGVNTTSRYRPRMKMTRSFPRLTFQLERAESFSSSSVVASSSSVVGGEGSLLVDDNRFVVSRWNASTNALVLVPPRRWNDSTIELLPSTPRRRQSLDVMELQATLDAMVKQFEIGEDAA